MRREMPMSDDMKTAVLHCDTGMPAAKKRKLSIMRSSETGTEEHNAAAWKRREEQLLETTGNLKQALADAKSQLQCLHSTEPLPNECIAPDSGMFSLDGNSQDESAHVTLTTSAQKSLIENDFADNMIAFLFWRREQGFHAADCSDLSVSHIARLREELKKWLATGECVRKNGRAEGCHMPLAVESGLICIVAEFCGIETTLNLMESCKEMHGIVVSKWLRASKAALKSLGIAVCSTVPVFRCLPDEVRSVVAATKSEQLIVCASESAVFFFAKRGHGDNWVVAAHYDDRHAEAFGWKQDFECPLSQRSIARPLAVTPTVKVSLVWETEVGKWVRALATDGDTVAVGMEEETILLSAQTGETVGEPLKGKSPAFVGKHRVAVLSGVSEAWFFELCAFATNTLVSSEMTIRGDIDFIYSMNATHNGKRLYITDGDNEQLLECDAAKWQLTKSNVEFSGDMCGEFDISANGLLAQGIYRELDDSFHVEVVETNTHCVTQIIHTEHQSNIDFVHFSPDSSLIISVSCSKSLLLFDAISGQLIGEPRIAGEVLSVCWLTDDWFVSVTHGGSIVVWHCGSQLPVHCFDHAHASGIVRVLRVTDGSFVTADSEGKVKKWRFECK